MSVADKIKEYATLVGFDACGVCRAETVDSSVKNHYEKWIQDSYQGKMDYLSRNIDKRFSLDLLVDNAKSVVSLALNYYPNQRQNESVPQFAYYAYGKDYHDVMKEMLNKLFVYIKILLPSVNGRVFVDTAPVLERYWAAKAGIGFIGKNTLLIIPKKGSFFFLGEIILDVELDYDKPLTLSCGRCTRCLEACPTKAIEKPYLINSNKCISYQTIENKGEISLEAIPKLKNRLYGCDICQQVCPWNRYSKPHTIKEFLPSDEFLSMDYDSINQMQTEDYQRIFKGSAVKRAKFSGIKRNIEALENPNSSFSEFS